MKLLHKKLLEKVLMINIILLYCSVINYVVTPFFSNFQIAYVISITVLISTLAINILLYAPVIYNKFKSVEPKQYPIIKMSDFLKDPDLEDSAIYLIFVSKPQFEQILLSNNMTLRNAKNHLVKLSEKFPEFSNSHWYINKIELPEDEAGYLKKKYCINLFYSDKINTFKLFKREVRSLEVRDSTTSYKPIGVRILNL